MRHLHKRTMGLEGTERGLHPALSQKKLDLRIKAETVTVGSDATDGICPAFVYTCISGTETIHMPRCICSSRDWRGFSAEIRPLFGSVWRGLRNKNYPYLASLCSLDSSAFSPGNGLR